MNILRHGSGVSYKVVTATSVLLLALVIGAPGILGHMGSVAASDVPTAYGGRAYGVYTEVPLYGGTYFADTGRLAHRETALHGEDSDPLAFSYADL